MRTSPELTTRPASPTHRHPSNASRSRQARPSSSTTESSSTSRHHRHIQISVPTTPEDKSEGQADEDQGRRQRGYSVRSTRAQYRLDPSSHIVNSIPRIVLFVSLSPACPLGSLFKEHQGKETGDGRGRIDSSCVGSLSPSPPVLSAGSLEFFSVARSSQLKEHLYSPHMR